MSDYMSLAAARSLVKGPFVVQADDRIDCIMMHPKHGDIPFTAGPDDDTEYGRLIYEALKLDLLQQPVASKEKSK